MRPTRSVQPNPLQRLLLISALVVGCSSCATITGTATGALTGLIDGPATVARTYEDDLRSNPEYWVLNLLVAVPLGTIFGPLAGFMKGVAVDFQWLRGELDYSEAFDSYDAPSIWRPWTFQWTHRGSITSNKTTIPTLH